ncbi:nucleotidyltransferase domain-containing protein [Serratia quinivorans]|uniref:nucleotidyltransferase domain-containing protein n=1 Tax=Serratia quinivorans TaxID=137545 RepID=UPI001C441BB0|nr:nucleotidyltransferase domain-containing protein [Serratia quinivorans]MBV6695141.1 nucleotidyltransferase domain-containing protein [Serratia quinivorans]
MTNDFTLAHYIEKYKHNACCILLVGSRAEGFATKTSDIDLIIITEEPEKYGVKSNHYVISAESGIKVEILIITKNDMKKSIKEAFTKDDFYTLQKILFGKITFGKWDFDREILQKAFRTRYYIKNTDQALKMYSALEGIKSDCHLQQYAFSLKKYMEKIAEIYLIKLGDNYIKPRWLISRLIRREGVHGTLLNTFFTAINLSITNTKDIAELERQVMITTALMLYKTIYEQERTIDAEVCRRDVSFFAMEREGRIVLFFGKEALLVTKEKAKLLIENMIFK